LDLSRSILKAKGRKEKNHKQGALNNDNNTASNAPSCKGARKTPESCRTSKINMIIASKKLMTTTITTKETKKRRLRCLKEEFEMGMASSEYSNGIPVSLAYIFIFTASAGKITSIYVPKK
jgi:hypothetical protein